MHIVKLKYYAVTIMLYDKREVAVLIKAVSKYEAEKFASQWRGTVMNVTPILVDPHTQRALTERVTLNDLDAKAE